MTRRAALVLALLIAAFPVLAQEIPVPERRSVAVGDMDFHGGDIRSIFDTEIGFCERACLAEARCRAFTFNSRNGSCFLKTDVTEMQPYQGAISALVLDLGEEAQARGIARARDLAFLPEGYLAAARRQAEGLGLAYPVAAANLAAITRPQADARSGGRNEETLVRLAAETSRTDRSTAWAAYGRMARSLSRGDVVVPGAINAYLRSGDPEEQAAALRLLADGLEAEGQGRLSILALRLAASLAPDPEAEAALERAVSLFGFRIVEHSVESDALEPRICLTFSESLAEAGVDYATYLRLPGPTLAVEAEGEALCITGVKHGQQYAFTVREGLPAANGETLARSVDLDLYVRDRSPSVRFTGRAYVLPKSAGTSIPVVTVNTETVEIRIHRIGDRNLLPAIQDGIFGASLSEWDETRIADRLGEAVWTGTAETERRVNEDVVTALPVGEAVTSFKPGAYAMTARVRGRGEYWENAATQWFVVTDLGLATLSGADGLHVFVRALSSALAREGVRLRLLAANNEVLGEAVTDAEGYARFAPGLARGTGGMAPALVAAADGEGDFAFLSLADPAFDLSDRGVEGREAPPPVDLFLSTERGAYRPGETVHATILARDSRVEAIAGLTLTAVVSRPDGVEHARIVLADQGAGGRALALPLGASAQRGTWRLRIHADPKAAALASASFLVEDFVPERIDFTLALPEGPVPFDAVPEVVVAARYLYGAPGAGLAIEGETAVRAARELEGFPGYLFGLEAEDFPPRFESLAAGSFTDEAGAANVAMALPELPAVTRPLTVTAHLRLAEGSGRPVERTITRPLAPQGVLIGIRPLFDGVLEEGALARFEVIAVGRDLSRTALPRAGWTLSRIETLWQWYQLDGEWYYEPVTRRERVATGMVEIAADAVARIEAPVRWGRYELKLGTLEGERAAASLEFGAGWYAPAAGSDTPDTLSVGLDKAAYRAGETARLRLAPRDAGQVLVRVVGDRLIAMRAVAVEAGESFVDLPVTEDWGPGAYVTATLIRPMDAPAGRNPSRAIGIAWAGIDPDERRLSASFQTPDAVDPRGPLEAVVQIEGLAPGEEAWATIAAVDVGILNLTGFAAPDPAGHYFGQRKLGMEIRDLYGRLIDGLQGDPGRLRSGGDGDLARLQSAPPTEELVAFFAGPVRAEADGTVRARFDLPDFNGTVRLMAVAWTATAVGQAQKDILVRDPVVVTASMPRFLAPGDESRILVELAHATGPSGAVRVEIAAGEGLSLPADAAVADVTLAALGRASLSLPVRAETV
ncbi:MAG TPA: MG2 domain-containing protein, partial [Paracoccaceae bacterium]|nr:MG2 domain-containing protein [Paracoccaceae bacterium]